MSGQTNQLVDYLRAIRRRWKIVAAATLLVMATALVLSLLSEKQYDATADLLFGRQAQVDGLLGETSTYEAEPGRRLNTDVELIKLDSVAAAVRERLGLDTSVDALLRKVSTETNDRSDLVKLVVRDTDPQRAAAIANGFADEYVDFRRRSARRNLDQAAELAQSRYDALSEADRASAQGEQLLARRRALEIDAALQTGGVEVVRRARAPEDPSRPRPKLSAATGLLLGLLLGIILALLLEFADRRLKDEQTVEEEFDLPLLAAIPPPPRRGGDDHIQREAYGMLAANVRLARGGEPQVVMTTSPSPEEGKTSVTLGVARALARLGLRVIVLEADLRRPSMMRHATLGPSRGLSGLLAGGGGSILAEELVWLDATSMRPVTLENVGDGMSFAVLPAGPVPSHAARLLARPEMGDIVETARSLADVVLIDTPPIGTVNDAVTLARFVDKVIVVARLNRTTKDAARRALRVLRNLDVELTGVAVTDAPLDGQYAYYGPDPGDVELVDAGAKGAER